MVAKAWRKCARFPWNGRGSELPILLTREAKLSVIMPRYQKWRNNYYVRDIILGMEENQDARHSRGCSMVDMVSPTEDPEMVGSSWTVLSSSGDGSSYQVNRINADDHDCFGSEKWCDMKCYKCDACRQKYYCECPDYQDNENMCKHIHAVCMFLDGHTNQENQAGPNGDVVLPRETREIETQTEPHLISSDHVPGTSRQENASAPNPTLGNPMQESSSRLSSGSDSEFLERPREVNHDLKRRILADALKIPQNLIMKYDQLNEPELRRVRILLRQIRHIVKDV